jgi:hypothetical protein
MDKATAKKIKAMEISYIFLKTPYRRWFLSLSVFSIIVLNGMGNLVNISTEMHEFYNSIAIGYK